MRPRFIVDDFGGAERGFEGGGWLTVGTSELEETDRGHATRRGETIASSVKKKSRNDLSRNSPVVVTLLRTPRQNLMVGPVIRIKLSIEGLLFIMP